MRRAVRLGVVLAVGLAASAAAQPTPRSQLLNETTLIVAPEQRVVVQLGEGGRLTLVSAEPTTAAAASPAAGQIVLTLSMAGPSGATLKVENGTDQPLDYEAALVLVGEGGKVQFHATTVCTVLPKISGHEIWSDKFDAVAVRNFHRADHEGIVCR